VESPDFGPLAHALLSPKRHVDKVYYARTAGRLTEEDRQAFADGLSLGDGLRCLPAGLEILSSGEESEAHVILREGKFHQVKRMLASRGKPVVYLERVQMGNLPLDRGLSRGSFRFLTEEEIARIVERWTGIPVSKLSPNTYQKGNEFFVEKRKNILQFGEVDDIIRMLKKWYHYFPGILGEEDGHVWKNLSKCSIAAEGEHGPHDWSHGWGRRGNCLQRALLDRPAVDGICSCGEQRRWRPALLRREDLQSAEWLGEPI
jgi:pseudouridine synthase